MPDKYWQQCDHMVYGGAMSAVATLDELIVRVCGSCWKW